ncbi:GMC family oxidoreductase [Myxococcota bacterium]|nr:GMC family oxidoreductase [Myxococcota bacterium]
MESFDAVCIGSGYGGTVPATRLGEGGMRVLVLERGPRWSSADFRQSDDPRYIQSVMELFVSSGNVAFRTGGLVGGASIPMDGAHFRMPRKSFQVTDASGARYWPEELTREALDPYYDRAEDMLRVRQVGWGEVPKAGGLFARILDMAGASCERARMNLVGCVHCGFSTQGCTFDRKWTLLHSYVPVAEAAGVEFRPGCQVDRIEPAGAEYVVRYIRDGEALEVSAPRVIVGAGGIHTPALLLRSAPYLPALSPRVGEGFNTNGEHAFLGILPADWPEVQDYYAYMGTDNGSVMSFHWFEEEGFTLHPGGGFEPSVLAASLEAASHPVLPPRSWGMEYKRFVEQVYPRRLIGFSALGLADGHRAVVLRGDGTADVEERDRTAYDAYLDRVEGIMAGVAKASGTTLVPAVPRELAGTTSAHLLGACRMGTGAEEGVVDGYGKVHGYDNLYVCDASAIPYALGVNPALTIAAVAERAAERILEVG